MGYTASEARAGKQSLLLPGILVLRLALYLVVSRTAGFSLIPEIEQYMGYGILFVIGLATSVHCIAMCGGSISRRMLRVSAALVVILGVVMLGRVQPVGHRASGPGSGPYRQRSRG